MEGNLKQYEDEKLGIYQGQVNELHVVLDKARAKREELQALYEKRHQDVLREISEMRGNVDSHTLSLMTALKQFSADFEQGVAQGKTSWRLQFVDHQREINARHTFIAAEQQRLHNAIEEERQECRQSIEEKGGVIRHQIAERSGLLQEQIKQRKKGNQDFLDKFNERFGELRTKLKEESEARELKCSEERAKAKRKFGDLNEDQKKKDAYR